MQSILYVFDTERTLLEPPDYSVFPFPVWAPLTSPISRSYQNFRSYFACNTHYLHTNPDLIKNTRSSGVIIARVALFSRCFHFTPLLVDRFSIWKRHHSEEIYKALTFPHQLPLVGHLPLALSSE